MKNLIELKQLPKNHVILRVRDYDGKLIDTITQLYDGTLGIMMSGTVDSRKERCGEKFWQILQGRSRSDLKGMNSGGKKKGFSSIVFASFPCLGVYRPSRLPPG